VEGSARSLEEWLLPEVGEADGKGWCGLEWACLGLVETLKDFEETWPCLHEVGQVVQKEPGVMGALQVWTSTALRWV
jgi:hypothetical protein